MFIRSDTKLSVSGTIYGYLFKYPTRKQVITPIRTQKRIPKKIEYGYFKYVFTPPLVRQLKVSGEAIL